jgi:GrpB-like predicted nucleotidyltransferase (UPF0157 family)
VADLAGALGADARRIDHIGSTAVPGLAAKDTIDLQLAVVDLELVDRRLTATLVGLGYTPTAICRDHQPAGAPATEPGAWAKRLFQRRAHPGGAVNLHVRREGAANERFARLFRDFLRAHDDLLPAYGEFKRRVALLAPDTAAYAEVKDPVVDLVVAMAARWAAATDWPG